MAFDKLQYIRTDKNGTKIFHDWTCPRCGGAGESSMWLKTGKVCFGCAGTGKRSRPLVVKEYTPEYAAKLEARRAAREEARQAAELADPDRERKIRDALVFRYAEQGCGADGVGYVLTGNTYPLKDKIKANGGKWLYGRWICPVKVSGKGVDVKRIDISESLGANGWIPGKPDMIDLIVD